MVVRRMKEFNYAVGTYWKGDSGSVECVPSGNALGSHVRYYE